MLHLSITNLYITCFIWCTMRYTMRWTHQPRKVTRSTKLRGAQRSPELALRRTDFRAPENFPALAKTSTRIVKYVSRVVKSNPANFPIRSRYVFYFMFSFTFKIFVMFVTFLLRLTNLYIVLARGKGTKKAFIEIFSNKKPKPKKPADPQLHFTWWVDRPSA